MIAQLTGGVVSVAASSCVIDVHGMGYQVLSTPSTLATLRAGSTVSLATHLVVREDALTLYGFATAGERDAFVVLQSVQGVGPRLALAMLAVHSPEALAHAVSAGDRAALEKVPGIGAKVASRLLLELGGRLAPAQGSVSATVDARGQVSEALVGLGWNAKAAEAALAAVAPDPIGEDEVSHTLRAALQNLGGQRG